MAHPISEATDSYMAGLIRSTCGWFVGIAVFVAMLIWADQFFEKFPQEKSAARQSAVIARRTKMVSEITYFRDKRTGLCFAHRWGGTGNGGPSLACVPCEAVEHLLIENEIE